MGENPWRTRFNRSRSSERHNLDLIYPDVVLSSDYLGLPRRSSAAAQFVRRLRQPVQGDIRQPSQQDFADLTAFHLNDAVIAYLDSLCNQDT